MVMIQSWIVKSVIFVALIKLAQTEEEKQQFDPNDCYEPGTIFEENEKNLGFCPCKYGYYGPECYEIFDCVIGEVRTENCSKEIENDYDLQWRCAASKKDIVKICTCPEGFRGETCEFIMENTVSTYWKTVTQSQKFFEVIYNKSDSFIKVAGSKVGNILCEYRRLIMFIVFVLILETAWRFTRKQQKQNKKDTKCTKETAKCNLWKNNQRLNLNRLKKSDLIYIPLKNDLRSLEQADELPEKKDIEEDSVSRITEISELSQNFELSLQDETKLHRPHLHI